MESKEEMMEIKTELDSQTSQWCYLTFTEKVVLYKKFELNLKKLPKHKKSPFEAKFKKLGPCYHTIQMSLNNFLAKDMQSRS